MKNTLVTGLKICKVGLALTYGWILVTQTNCSETGTSATGKMDFVMVKVLFTTLMGASTKVIGLKTSKKAMVYSLLRMALNMRVHSNKIGWLIE